MSTSTTTTATVERSQQARQLDPALLAIIANRFDAIVREMTNTLLRSARSAVIGVARDFSCTIVTADDHLLSSAEGVPVHIFGSHLQTAEMRRLHSTLKEGDAFLDNDPYVGNTHTADHTILVPVFIEEEHLFTVVVKAHQADLGNSLPTSYMAFATDIYEEGALVFPCVQVQRNYHDVDDIIRMAKQRIRVPEQWYGDYLAAVGAARIGERRLKELLGTYGKSLIEDFISEWFDYSERRIAAAISDLPSCTLTGYGGHDSFGPFERIPIKVVVSVDGENGRVEVDLRDNPDCVSNGLNQSRATAINNVVTGIFNVLDPDIPHNSGSFRRMDVRLRDNCVVGIPQHPTSCSVATTNVADRLVNITQAVFENASEDMGVAEGGSGLGAGYAVISGSDPHSGNPYVNQVIIGNNGGPGTSSCDGWLTYNMPVAAGMLYRDSIEIDEQKYPLHFQRLRLLPDSGGPGRSRGAPCAETVYGPKRGAMTIVWAIDGHETPPRGIHGGHSGRGASAVKIDKDGRESVLPPVGNVTLEPGECIAGVDCGGAGWGSPLERDPQDVLRDVLERWVTATQAEDVYGVVLAGGEKDVSLRVNREATRNQRRTMA